MASESEPDLHPVLLGIAAISFMVLMILGLNLYTKDTDHQAGAHTSKEYPKGAH